MAEQQQKKKSEKAGRNRGKYARWLAKGGMTRKLRRVIRSCGTRYARSWAMDRGLLGIYAQLVKTAFPQA